MKKSILTFLLCGCGAIFTFAERDVSAFIQPSKEPTPLHRQMIARKYGMFIHFGINTFHDQGWTDGTLPALSYAPTKLDTDNWAKAAKDAKMRYVLLVCKHHDGFCLWDSKYTEYDVANSSNPTDVVASLAKSCKKYGIQMGLYYSLWDRNWGNGVMRPQHPAPMNSDQAARYVEYMKNQLTELFSNYGPICELWLDGGWTQPSQIWNIPEIYATVKKLQPNCAIAANWTIGKPDSTEWCILPPAEQKEGYPIRYFPSDFRLGDPTLPSANDPKLFSHAGKLYYMPFESTITLNRRWFFNTKDNELKTVEELSRIYKQATAENNILILNSPPNREGLMQPRNCKRLKELAEHLGL